jgi:HEAT repeat protein
MKRVKWIALLPLFLLVPLVIALSSRNSARNHRIEDLDYALGNEDAAVRLGAVVSLTEYGESAVPSLQKALTDDDPKVKQATVAALGKIGGQEAADALAKVLSDPDRDMRVRAIVWLGATGRPALPHLYKALETEPFPRGRMFAAHSIGRLARPGDAPEILKRFDKQDAATQMHLTMALAKVGDKEAYEGFSRLMESQNKLVRFYVVNAITEAGPNKRALPILTKSLEDEAVEVRMWGMFGLEQLKAPESYPAVVVALNDVDPYVRKEAAYTLGDIGNRDAVPRLVACLGDPHYLVRADAAESLGKLGNEETITVLKPLLCEDSPAVQIKAAEALTRLNDYSGMETLIATLDSPEALYRIEASRALQRISRKDLGTDKQAWQDWWEQEGKTLTTGSGGETSDN